MRMSINISNSCRPVWIIIKQRRSKNIVSISDKKDAGSVNAGLASFVF